MTTKMRIDGTLHAAELLPTLPDLDNAWNHKGGAGGVLRAVATARELCPVDEAEIGAEYVRAYRESAEQRLGYELDDDSDIVTNTVGYCRRPFGLYADIDEIDSDDLACFSDNGRYVYDDEIQADAYAAIDELFAETD